MLQNKLFKQPIRLIASMPTHFYILVLVILAVAVRLISITKASIWHDEGYTMMLIKDDVLGIIERTARDVHPPLYYIFAHYWGYLFGDSEFAIRSFSLVCGVAMVVAVYFLVRRLFNEKTARLAGIFVALGPFVVRYSEEARMYSLAALLVVLATLALVVLMEQKKQTGTLRQVTAWIGYGVLLVAAFYTHYFTVFIVPIHLWYALRKSGGLKKLVSNRGWWLGNVLAVALFLPWLPSAIAQFSRVQAGFWIPPVDLETLPNTIIQFLIYTSDGLPTMLEMGIILMLVAMIIFFAIRSKQRVGMLLLAAWTFVPLVVVLALSIKRPVYYDRYFVYCAVAFYILLAVMIMQVKWRSQTLWLRNAIVAAVFGVFGVGMVSVDNQANHKMRDAGHYVSSHYETGDTLVSAELYTYFDFSYYNKTGADLLLLWEGDLDGYGETSLLYDRQDTIVIHDFETVESDSGRVWLVGKTGQHDYFDQDIPASWRLVDQFEAKDSAIRLYEISPVSRY